MRLSPVISITLDLSVTFITRNRYKSSSEAAQPSLFHYHQASASMRYSLVHFIQQYLFGTARGLLHPAIVVGLRLVAMSCIWKAMDQDVRILPRKCFLRQLSKVHKQAASSNGTVTMFGAHFSHVHH